MQNPAFFGYGSLVNRLTHDYPGAQPAQLTGWRRIWVQTPARPLAYLSVEPCADTRIDGLLAEVPGGDWAALDLREAAYARHPVTVAALPGVRAVQVYAVSDAGARQGAPILLSYLDAVVQGFAREWGSEGVQRFFGTTAGWQGGIVDDRTAPRYPRAQRLTARERALVDAGLAALGLSPAPA